MTVQDIISRVQKELQDATGSSNRGWTDADYILGKLATIGDDIAVRLQLLDLNYSTQEVILPNVAANTTDLSQFQATGQVLSQMILPKSIEWRLVGQTQEQWSFVKMVDKLIDTDTGTGETEAPVASDDPTVESYEWRQGILRVSPCMEPVDYRVRFVGTAISLNTNSTQQVIGLTNVYVYKCCQVIVMARASGMTTLAAGFEKRFNTACADFEGLSMKTEQSKRFRLGGRRSASSAANSGFTSPIINN